MAIVSISKPHVLQVFGEKNDEVYYGCDQEWFPTKWQRLSGCGPSVASNILFYLNNTQHFFEKPRNCIHKKECLLLMEEIWNYVTPTSKGIYTTKMFYEAVLSYTKAKGIPIAYEFIDVPEEKSKRPESSKVIHFMKKALSHDVPIAFLNLCNGKEKRLERWHWVTIISLEYEQETKHTFLTILDEGLIKKIDFELWYSTTTQGGGFVYFTQF